MSRRGRSAMVVPAGSVQARMIWGAAIAAMISFISPGSTENAAKSCETRLSVAIRASRRERDSQALSLARLSGNEGQRLGHHFVSFMYTSNADFNDQKKVTATSKTERKSGLMIAPAMKNGMAPAAKGPKVHAIEIIDHHRLPSSEEIPP
jgi:hypothetical protein